MSKKKKAKKKRLALELLMANAYRFKMDKMVRKTIAIVDKWRRKQKKG